MPPGPIFRAMGKLKVGLQRLAAKLAGSGSYSSWTGVAQRLREEGYDSVDVFFSNATVRDQIDKACKQSFHS